MKRKYEKPMMMVEAFEADEYVATCVTIKCNLNAGKLLWKNEYDIEINAVPTAGIADGCGEEFNIDDSKLISGFRTNSSTNIKDIKSITYWVAPRKKDNEIHTHAHDGGWTVSTKNPNAS